MLIICFSKAVFITDSDFLIGGGTTASYFYSTQKKTALKTNVVFFFVANSGFEPESPP